jgi:probable HAF family extracellular repeat protein
MHIRLGSPGGEEKAPAHQGPALRSPLGRLAAGAAIGLAACTSVEAPSDPRAPDMTRAGSASYRALDLGVLGGDLSEARDINARGYVVGWNEVDGHTRAVLWRNGVITDLGTLPGGSQSIAEAVNDRGEIAGESWTAGDTEIHPVVWSRGHPYELGSLGGRQGQSTGIGPSGQVVGWSETPDGEAHPFLWTRGRMLDLDPAGGRFTWDVSINAAGQVVYGRGGGTDGPELPHGYTWVRGASSDLGEGLPAAMDPSGTVAGNHFFPAVGRYHAVVWTNGRMTDLGTLGGPSSTATDINAAGEVVGWSETATGESHAFVWSGGAMIDLGTLGGPLSYAFAINSAGHIVGSSRLGPEGDELHAVLWTRR